MSSKAIVHVSQLIKRHHDVIDFTEEMRLEYASKHDDIVHCHAPPVDDSADILNAMTYSDSSDQRENRSLQDSYGVLGEHISQQFAALESYGVRFIEHSGNDEPYVSSAEMLADLDNRTLTYLPTSQTGTIENSHPLMRMTALENDKGKKLRLNDVFRCVHSAIAHSAGYDFSFEGEKGAWLIHRNLLPRTAHLALWNETRGQNAWMNAGEHIRVLDGKGFYYLPKKGDPDWVSPRDRISPYQKCVLAPSWMV